MTYVLAAILVLVAAWQWLVAPAWDLELVLRLLAAAACIAHPIDQQANGFRERFNIAVNNHPWIDERTKTWPLGAIQNAAETALLIALLPMAALVGGWSVVMAAVGFAFVDANYTHYKMSVPGFVTAVVALLALCGVEVVVAPSEASFTGLFLAVGAVGSGMVAGMTPWWLARWRVRRQEG